MLNGYNLIIDTFSQVHPLLAKHADVEFWDFASIDKIEAGSILVIGRNQYTMYINEVKEIIKRPGVRVVLDNCAEGSVTLIDQFEQLGLNELVKKYKTIVISGSTLPKEYNCIEYNHLLRCIVDYSENQKAMQLTPAIFDKYNKPYKFLFLNGRNRPHRKYLVEKFKDCAILDDSLWSMLDGRMWPYSMGLDIDILRRPTEKRFLPTLYEYHAYRSNAGYADCSSAFAKHELFNNEWGEIYIEPAQYIDTYFSVVTETVFNSPYTFFTEKIAKPLAMGHPFIVAANAGFYRDLRKSGFKTFNGIIDESFDLEIDPGIRLDMIVNEVKRLCNSDLDLFLSETRAICEHNQAHLLKLAKSIQKKFYNEFIEKFKRK